MKKAHWILPALASLAFLVFSIVVATSEGLFGFAVEHSRNLWSVQILIDLASAALVALVFIAPAARRVGVRMAPWVVLTVLTGSIGLLALAARVCYAQAKMAGLDAASKSPAQRVA